MTELVVADVLAEFEEHEQTVTTRVLDATASLLDDAHAVLVRSDEEAEAATDFLSLIAGEKRRATEARRFLVDPLNAHVNAINARFKPATEILDQARVIVEPKIVAYRARRERERQEEIRRLEAEEAARVAAENAERDRLEAAARAIAEQAAEAARRAEADAKAGTADDEAALAAAEFAAATAALQQERAAAPVAVAIPVRAPEPARALGRAASRTRWVAKVTHPADVPRALCSPDQRLIDNAVSGGARSIPGVLIEQRSSLAVRAS